MFIFTLGDGQKQNITFNLHSFTQTGWLAFKMIKRDGEELLDILAAVETDHCDEDTFLLVLVESVHNEQFLVAERHSVLVALLWELNFFEFTGNDLDFVILMKNIYCRCKNIKRY